MPPIYVKGGVWTNVEDEILRAAISKYGLNQWARVSSLLARKTAKQAKARWTEWLNPTIKKIEWSRDEDEKLLHLAKLMPTQWRTIAPLVGRTATQCIERYQQLLEDAEQQITGKDLSLTGPGAEASASKRVRFGEDATPESKPARPDAIDMDEDEKEMLSEARARLANTQGKKAKRKDRERLLEQSRRLATLQKRRELKLAGINTKLAKRDRKTVDYNADIPFEHKPAPGFYDTTEEDIMNLRAKAGFDRKTNKTGVFMRESGTDSQGKKRYRDKATEIAAAEQSAQARAQHLEELNQADQLSKRRRLELPAPQVDDAEIEQIVKFGTRGDRMQKMYNGGDAQGLVGEYGSGLESMRTPQMAQDRVLESVREIQAISEQGSVLGGVDDVLPLPRPRMGGSKDVSVPRTPNPLALGPGMTPRRDALGFNTGASSSQDLGRSLLRAKFKSLPKPLNNFEILVPEEKSIEIETDILIPDRGELEAEEERRKQEEHEQELAGRSQVLRRNLPRPVATVLPKISEGEYAAIAYEIQREMQRLIISDNEKYPEVGEGHDTDLPVLDETLKAQAFAEIEQEVSKDAEFILKTNTLAASLDVPYVLPGLGPDKKEYTAAKEALAAALVSTATEANDAEKKLQKTMAGYMRRQQVLSDKMAQAYTGIAELAVERALEETLLQNETVALSARLGRLQEEVNFLTDAERRGQELYREYQMV
ncbi:uncharacterized protein SAPINGB_P000374 [Magnusiomyces paraingens]|uniref:Pre-mRNA-splicing factor CEF1 n=1 Tax=Magnusiomyces paraingens TaxID=2606893 RepID=A0A5E8B659_9ASCO|nr:uncharacterized protein SAPINGB_P000374 [Saprochaete ingens]VVT44311.1 unnamed protein product [Saprochaete ingens]